MLAVAQFCLHVLPGIESALDGELLATRLLVKDGHGFQEHRLEFSGPVNVCFPCVQILYMTAIEMNLHK